MTAKPTPRPAAVAAATNEYTSRSAGAPNTATAAPASRSPDGPAAYAACTAPPACTRLCSTSAGYGGVALGVCHTSARKSATAWIRATSCTVRTVTAAVRAAASAMPAQAPGALPPAVRGASAGPDPAVEILTGVMR
ncbi:hypothetical protein [Streptomyces purpurascens]